MTNRVKWVGFSSSLDIHTQQPTIITRERENKLIAITNITKIPSTYLPPKTKKISYVKGKQLQGVLKKPFCKVKFENNKTSAQQINTGEVKHFFYIKIENCFQIHLPISYIFCYGSDGK